MKIFIYIILGLNILVATLWSVFEVSASKLFKFSLIPVILYITALIVPVFYYPSLVQFVFSESVFYPLIFVWALFLICLISYFLLKSKDSNKILTKIAFCLSLLIFLVGLEAQKSTMNSWKGSLSLVALVIILSALIIQQSLTYCGEPSRFHAIGKIALALFAIGLFVLQFFGFIPSLTFNPDILFDKLVIISSISLLIEGLIIYRKRVDLT